MEKRFKSAVDLAQKAGSFLISSRCRTETILETAHDVKLKQDLQSEDIIVSGIERLFPGDGYLSEEIGEKKSDSGHRWVIDPIDGTVNYSRGIPHCCVSISCHSPEGEFGVVFDFFGREMFTAKKGQGAFLGEKEIRVSSTSSMKEAVVCINLMPEKKDFNAGKQLFMETAHRVKKVRMLGAAALDLCYVAAGRVDLFMEVGLHEWDISAGRIILREAGGVYDEVEDAGIKLIVAGNGLLNPEELWKSRGRR